MLPLDQLHDLVEPTPGKIVLFVLDGLGGLPRPDTGRSELETARLPHLDALAARGICGLIDPVSPGITPGSGPAHLALFGYDPVRYQIGRGVLSALGIGFPMGPNDVAARMNFATLDADGHITDRRAGRISTETNRALVEKLRTIRLPAVEVFVETESQHRAVLVLRGEGLSDRVADTDPQRVGVPPEPARALAPEAERTAELVRAFVAQAGELLRDDRPANALLLRGFADLPDIPRFPDVYGMRSAAIAVYPMYRGLARLLGMDVLDPGPTVADELALLRERWDAYDFFYVHVKAPDLKGEDGDFDGKVAVLEEIDQQVPTLVALGPEALAVTGDHSTPALLRGHSWHAVPFVLVARTAFADEVRAFDERAALRGGLGRFSALHVMPLLLAHAGKLTKYGA
ncbi:MAG: 2,3-bisphosphoglycerate-independent phosphoglycerate mutase [Chloroflexi bacterium]|nr:2,3-bisphosphoglycerate-independent phosphoglycerate mutase [Chloroflexota bacterium]